MPPHTRTATTLLLALAAAACAAGDRAETYGFIATLGSDTTSVERITRTGDRIVSDAVGRSPTVVRRHWEATLASDGSLRSWTMDTHIPNAPEGERDLHHEMQLYGDTVRLIRRTPAGNTDVAYLKPHGVVVPWNAFVYGTWELLLQQSAGLPDTARIGQYFFEGWSEGRIGHAQLRRLEDGGISIRSTGLAGAGVARMDERGRLVSYDGAGTTYRQAVQRITDVPDLAAIVERFAADERQRGGMSRALSVRDTARADVGGVTLTVEYSRPLARGRTLVGGLIPYDAVWRTGANAATHITISAPVRLAGVDLDAGSYTLWTLPTRDGVQLIINTQTGHWGTGYQQRFDLARVPMQTGTTDSHVEPFTIRIDDSADTSALVMEWGSFRWSAPIEPRD